MRVSIPEFCTKALFSVHIKDPVYIRPLFTFFLAATSHIYNLRENGGGKWRQSGAYFLFLLEFERRFQDELCYCQLKALEGRIK